jgi:cation transport ATPase
MAVDLSRYGRREWELSTATNERQGISEDEKEEMRRFWGRVVFSLGMLAGMTPMAVPPLAVSNLGMHTAMLEVLALIVFSVSVLPASVLAFWHRREATAWLLLAGVAAAALVLTEQHVLAARGIRPDYGSDYLFAIPLALGVFGIFTGWLDWPRLVERHGRRGRA